MLAWAAAGGFGQQSLGFGEGKEAWPFLRRAFRTSASYWVGPTHLCILCASSKLLGAWGSRPAPPRVCWKTLELNQLWITVTSERPGWVGRGPVTPPID